MNSSQQESGAKLARQAEGQGHVMREFKSPISVLVRCSCGWSHTERRQQNALARASKMSSATRQHALNVIALLRSAETQR